VTAISHVLTVFNKAWALPEVWRSLAAQRGEHEREFIFVDDGSTDNSVELLRGFAKSDPRIRIIENSANAGPAIRLNQGVVAAQGRWLHLIDGDDAVPPNACERMLLAAQSYGAPLVYGRRRVTKADPIPEDAGFALIDTPLVFAAERPIVHMALMVERDLFNAAGGCDERIFIQDQSLPLRLCAKADRMLWTDATVACQNPEQPGELSRNRMQQHHDRFFSAYNVLSTLSGPIAADAALRRLCVSAHWKARRDAPNKAPAWLSAPFAEYLKSKMKMLPDNRKLDAFAEDFLAMDGIRRPAP